MHFCILSLSHTLFFCFWSCIWAVSGSCRRLNGVCLFPGLGDNSLLLMQWERSRGVAGQAETAALSHRVTDWTNSNLCSNNIALVARGERTMAFVMLFCDLYHISDLKKCPTFLLPAYSTIAMHWLCLSVETVQTYSLCCLWNITCK